MTDLDAILAANEAAAVRCDAAGLADTTAALAAWRPHGDPDSLRRLRSRLQRYLDLVTQKRLLTNSERAQSGRRVTRPSHDPAAASRAALLESGLARTRILSGPTLTC